MPAFRNYANSWELPLTEDAGCYLDLFVDIGQAMLEAGAVKGNAAVPCLSVQHGRCSGRYRGRGDRGTGFGPQADAA